MTGRNREAEQLREGSAGNNYVSKEGIIKVAVYLIVLTVLLFSLLFRAWKSWPACDVLVTAAPAVITAPAGDVIIEKISPNTGFPEGDTKVTITGKGFEEGAIVRFGGVPSEKIEFVDSTLMFAVTPRHPEGAVDVMVRNTDGDKHILDKGYTYACHPPKRHDLLWIIMLAGALGGTIHALRSFYWYVGNRRLVLSWVLMYIMLPLVGAAMAVIFYLIIGGGFFSPTSTTQDTSLIIIAVATLVGLFSQQAALKLQDIANAVLTKPEAGRDRATEAAVSVSKVEPDEGPALGGNEVKITGKGFADQATVKFGGVAAVDLKVVNNETISVKAPAHAPGNVNVVVTNPDGESASLPRGYTYTDKTPLALSRVEPDEGATSGEEEVTITGAGFLEGATVMFEDEPAAEVTVVSGTEIIAKTPPHPGGSVDVTVTNPDGAGATLSQGYTYREVNLEYGEWPGPKIEPDSGPTGGGTEVKITGTRFSSVKEITFGGVPVPADNISLDGATSVITVLAPKHEAGEVEVAITNVEGETVTIERKFVYVPEDDLEEGEENG